MSGTNEKNLIGVSSARSKTCPETGPSKQAKDRPRNTPDIETTTYSLRRHLESQSHEIQPVAILIQHLLIQHLLIQHLPHLADQIPKRNLIIKKIIRPNTGTNRS
jgi:hypothetical protein